MLKPLGHYFNFSSVLLTRTSSHMWGRWYLPIFLFRDGLLIYITSAHTNVVIPSTTMATTSANSYCGYNICHSQKISFKCGIHLPQTNKKVAITSATMAKKHQPWHNHIANNICQQHPVVANQLWQHPSHPTAKKKSWPNIFKKNTTYGKHANIWLKIPTKIIKNNIPHTPTKVGVMVR